MAASAEPTLRALLQRRDLGLALVPLEADIPEGALDRPLRWVHSSDLADPTPFLSEDLALLTTGTQFDEAVSIDTYVGRLADRGVLGLGFGTEVHRSGIPEELVAACAAHGMPLFTVPYRTPFIAVARAHSETIAAQAYARRSWALDTQRALALAALRPHGLDATIAELGRRLGVWAGMFDAAGALTLSHPRDAVGPPVLDGLGDRVMEILTRGLEAGQSLSIDEHSFMLFTVGRGGHLRGVIALALDALDPEARSVVTSVIAMAGLAMEQSEQLARSRRRLHAQLLGSLLTDDPALARRVLGSLPPAPVVVAVAADAPAGPMAEWWERHRAEHGTSVFLAESEDGVTMCISVGDDALLDEVAARFGIRIGVSDPDTYDSFARAHAQALTALRQHGTHGVARYADTVGSSILTALATDEARLVAESRLAPVREHDARTGAELERSLRTWLEHDARAESAAAALGVHRHTLRSRITQAGALLDIDLSTFPARAELWTILQTARD
ncbi:MULTISPECIES: PucR family transcriptional regulator [unclassified Microbacterium]|uniref:PucR family transcriptional regulator n=1 Tax=unclassified Microbacterium TaxID=2609290 RepID=UPI000CFE0044|nr:MULTISPECIES: PucR family transcriptional regulator [unclassified Microbacterium]PQZ52473.1 PucR family transcriptional regulator [Microbacterium sp. MYb43]PQZ73023.1 PucR family transcriptional regulator [Microbacterium sp. MYb40]PRB21870.1 PucR family transcriptional regulator [Microbacterium sp. MYb54]PRB31630.1 PucR family transcriptional regulator [Microbacterium sp. MYb50]PRB61801.1 PucR family transcriptional regulator [Microbacterium sp. MYb24]